MRAYALVTVAAVSLTIALPAAAADRPMLAVLDFAGAQAKLSDAEVQALTGLARKAALELVGDRFDIITRENLVDLLKGHGKTLEKCQGECETETGRLIGADVVVTGTITHVFKRFNLELKAHRTSPPTLLAYEQTDTKDAGKLPDAVRASAQKLYRRIRGGKGSPDTGGGSGGGGAGGWDPDEGGGVLVTFRSQPTGAVVMVDGDMVCQATPCSKELAAGMHAVEMLKDAYVAKRGDRAFVAGTEVTFELEPDFGTLRVTSKPTGLAATVDGKDVGVTPTGDLRLAPGRHRVEVKGPCHYKAWEKPLVARGKKSTTHLAPEVIPAGLRVVARDAKDNDVQADVYVDGAKVGRTPKTFRVAACAREVEVRHRKLGTWRSKLELREKKTTKLTAKLRKGGAARKGFVRIEPGTFTMGSPLSESGRDADEGPTQQVTISRGFSLSSTEVTQGQWRSLMGTRPSHFSSCGATCPVEQVSWWGALAYMNALSKREGLPACFKLSGCTDRPGDGAYMCTAVKVTSRGEDPTRCTGYRLPTEAEWEYAARAGTGTALYTGGLTIRGKRDGPELDAIAWYGGNSGVSYEGGFDCLLWDEKQRPSSKCGPHPVGQKQANPWGLYDMLGNVWEWTWDRHGSYSRGTSTDPTGPSYGSNRVFRGCGWAYVARLCRAAYRVGIAPEDRGGHLGFRPARSLP